MTSITESAVLRYHYAQLANARNIASAGLIITANEDERRRASTSHSYYRSQSPSLIHPPSNYGHDTNPLLLAGVDSDAIDPVLLALDMEREADELGALARAIMAEDVGDVAEAQTIGEASGSGHGGPGSSRDLGVQAGLKKAPRKWSRLSEVEVNSVLAGSSDGPSATPTARPRKKKISSAEVALGAASTSTLGNIKAIEPPQTNPYYLPHQSPHPHHSTNCTSTPSHSNPNPSVAPIAISTAHLLKSRLLPSSSKSKSALPSHMGIIPTLAPNTPQSSLPVGAGMEVDELSTPFQPLLFGKSMPQQSGGTPGLGGVPARLGMLGGRMAGIGAGGAGIGVGKNRQSGVGWAVGTPVAASRGIGGA